MTQRGQFLFLLGFRSQAHGAILFLPLEKTAFGDAQLSTDLLGRLATLEPHGHCFLFEHRIELSPRLNLYSFGRFFFNSLHVNELLFFSLNSSPSNRSNLK